MNRSYVIEKRQPDGSLDFSHPQPEDVFGLPAIVGISEQAIARTVFARQPDAVLTGDSISRWPSLIDPRFVARVKYW